MPQNDDSVFSDTSEIYCKKLGHNVPFSYCQIDPETGVKPGLCSQIRNCWYLRGNIDEFLLKNHSKDELEELGKTKTPKTVTLVDLIHKVKGKE